MRFMHTYEFRDILYGEDSSFTVRNNNHRLFLTGRSVGRSPFSDPIRQFSRRRRVEKSDTVRDPSCVFIATNHAGTMEHTRARARFLDKPELSARGTSIVISIGMFYVHPSLLSHTTWEPSSSRATYGCTHVGRLCGHICMYRVNITYIHTTCILCTQSLLWSTDSKTANTRVGATKPQTKANAIAERVSRAYVVPMSSHMSFLPQEKKEINKRKKEMYYFRILCP